MDSVHQSGYSGQRPLITREAPDEPGGHLATSEHPDLLAAAIRDIAERHGAGAPAAASR